MILFFTWYFPDIPLLLAIILPTFLTLKARPGAASWPGGAFGKWMFVSGAALLFAGSSIQAFARIEPLPPFKPDKRCMVHTIMSATKSLNASGEFNENVRVGSFNAGMLGYFSKAKVINLDGLANNDIYYSVFKKHGKLFSNRKTQEALLEYVKLNRIEYISDVMVESGYFGNMFTHVEFKKMFDFAFYENIHDGWPVGYYLSRISPDAFPYYTIDSIGVQVFPLRSFKEAGGERWRQRNFIFNSKGRFIGNVEFKLEKRFKSLRLVAFVPDCKGDEWTLIARSGKEVLLSEPMREAPRELAVPLDSRDMLCITFLHRGKTPAPGETPVASDLVFE